MRKRRQIELFSLSFLDLISGALGAVIILYVAIPKNKSVTAIPEPVQVVDRTKEVKTLQDKIEELKKSNESLQTALIEANTPKEPAPVAAPVNMDIGFKFAGKKIVFIIDTSYSMTQEDRMGQVKAGLKMLLIAYPA